jgi:hypothetical protein
MNSAGDNFDDRFPLVDADASIFPFVDADGLILLLPEGFVTREADELIV